MEIKKSLLSISGHIFDITGLAQVIGAATDERIRYSGIGIITYRGNGANGNGGIFLKCTGEKLIFGELVDIYIPSNEWNLLDYNKFEMLPMEHEGSLNFEDANLLSSLLKS